MNSDSRLDVVGGTIGCCFGGSGEDELRSLYPSLLLAITTVDGVTGEDDTDDDEDGDDDGAREDDTDKDDDNDDDKQDGGDDDAIGAGDVGDGDMAITPV